MYLAILITFITGYFFIALEHTVKIDKAATALLTGTICWVLLIIGGETLLPDIDKDDLIHFIPENLRQHLGEIAEILFFLLGAMTIVEIIDAHEGFSVVTDRIKTKNRVKLIWILSVLTFFLSAALDNLTTAIVMSTLLKKLVADKKDIWMFAGILIIAANAGGAWSPIGDITTIMLWIGGQITAVHIMYRIIIQSMICLLVPLIIVSFRFKGSIKKPVLENKNHFNGIVVDKLERRIVFILGIAALLFVPIFKMITHLPPFMGILFGLSVVWIVTEILHRNKPAIHKKPLSIMGVLQKIDATSILFFLGILIAVASLQSAGHLIDMARLLDNNLNNIYIVNTVVGFLSSIVDNVPLVAGAMGMYSTEVYPVNHLFWELLAYCAGTGGSILIIGSAAGVAVMGILKIDFVWYLKNISFLAFVGYISGVLAFLLFN